jgi:hypothetical protein
MLFRSIPRKLADAKAELRKLAERAATERDKLNDTVVHLANLAMDHDDVAFEIEQMLGPVVEFEPEGAEVTSSDDEENN